MTRLFPRFALVALVFALAAPLASPAALALTLDPVMTGDEVQSIRFCRPGERPVSAQQCMVRGQRPLI